MLPPRAAALILLALAVPHGVAHSRQQFPPPRGFVNDFAGVIPAPQAARIEALARYVRDRSKGEIVVVTLPDIGGRDVGDMALRLGREWKVGANTAIGDETRNTGVVILVVPKETSRDGRGHISIQTGQGTEGFLTDAQAGEIRREAIPLLQQRDYGGALALITARVAQRYAASFGFALDSFAIAPPAPAGRRVRGPDGEALPAIALALFVVILFLLSAVGARRGRGRGCLWLLLASQAGRRRRGGWHHGGGGGWSGGGFGGGGFGGGGFGGFGGGGGFSGGGSSGSW